jgi:hypothetical protein
MKPLSSSFRDREAEPGIQFVIFPSQIKNRMTSPSAVESLSSRE